MQSENTSFISNSIHINHSAGKKMGYFIVVEGLEGAGKSSAIAAIALWIEQQGVSLLTQTREPGGTPLAEKMRSLVKEVNTQEVLTAEAELLLMYASRVQLVNSRIRPTLEAGGWVLGDRHDLSSQAYQGGGRGLDMAMIANIKQAVLGDFKPDLTLYLDIDPKIGLARAQTRGELDRIEMEQLEFFQRTRRKYQELVALDCSIKTIDASQTMPEVAADIINALDLWYKDLGQQ